MAIWRFFSSSSLSLSFSSLSFSSFSLLPITRPRLRKAKAAVKIPYVIASDSVLILNSL